jgi:tRNA A-37 threonylcarbamoyl transferase component Bud32
MSRTKETTNENRTAPAADERRPGAGSRVDTLPDAVAKLLRLDDFTVGDVIGSRYRLEKLLGRGAMGQVFLAENLAIGLKVAVKVLHPELLADANFRQRFQYEAQAVATVQHPNVTRCFDLVVGDPTFLAMEYAPGPTLRAVLDEHGRLSPLRAVTIAERLAWGLEAAHAVGVIHRDLKPANIILATGIEREEPKIVDFGLAKLLGLREGDGLTRTGQIIGTPFYMSPEQITGGQVTAQSDVYSLGCVLFEMLTGRTPFHNADDFQILYRQLHIEPPSPSQLVPDLPAALEQTVRRALAKQPADRFSSMAEMARALIGSVEKRRGGRRGAPRPTWARNALLLALAGVLGLGTLGAMRLRRLGGSNGDETQLILMSDPSGANIYVDGKPRGRTPAALHDLSPGEHELRLHQDGHTDLERRVTLARGEPKAMDVVLTPASRWMDITTAPAGARLFLDGKLVAANTPARVLVTEDDFHELRIERDGYQSQVRPIVPEDRSARLEVRLQQQRKQGGSLMVDAIAEAEVWIDGENTGYVTPTIWFEVSVGKHVIELRDGVGHRSESQTVDVKQGDSLRVMMRTAPPSGGH